MNIIDLSQATKEDVERVKSYLGDPIDQIDFMALQVCLVLALQDHGCDLDETIEILDIWYKHCDSYIEEIKDEKKPTD